jgi:hypothetical protein
MCLFQRVRIEGKTENREIFLKGKTGYLSLKKNKGKFQEKVNIKKDEVSLK